MNRYKTRLILITVISAICLVVVGLIWHAKVDSVCKYNETVNQWNMDLINLKVVPTPENIFILQREYEWLLEREKEVKQLLSKKQITCPELTPLQFKEELLNTQTKLKQLADIQGCKLQEDLGFSEYTAGEIPQARDVIVLTKQLVVINEIVKILLKNKVSEIGYIARLGDITQTKVAEENLCQEIVFRMEMGCVLEDLLNVLKDLVNAPYILVVRNLKIDKLDESKVSAELVVGAMEFK